MVRRPQLIERLNAGLASGRRLTLISAAAGFGKTTLVASWLSERMQAGQPDASSFAWLSLDAGDSDLPRFLSYLVAALQTMAAPIGAGVLGLLQAPQAPPIEVMLTALLNDLSSLTDQCILVLDDYHMIDSPSVDQALAFLIEHLPPQLHLVIATREDPHLPLARLRARSQLTELRAADLRFSPTEAAAFLNQVMGLHLTPEDIAALEGRTEGWITGLQLAALSMQGRSDTASFIASFTGSHRFILDYLIEEVLQRQPEYVQTFLLRSSILDRMCGSLCDAVVNDNGGKMQDKMEDKVEDKVEDKMKDKDFSPSCILHPSSLILQELERDNLFIVPLDDQRQWYRYHHLFSEVLLEHALEAQPDQIPRLHKRASAWYEHNSLPAEAIRHALAAEDFERAAGLIELAHAAMSLGYQSSTWLGWAKALPDELLRTRPVLSVGYAWALLDCGELEATEAPLQDAERCLETPTDEIVVVDEEEFRSLAASIATARAYRSLALGDITSAVIYAQQALKRTPDDDQTRYKQAISLLGLAQYTSGDLEAAERSLADFHTSLRKSGDILTLIGITFLLADIRVALGRLHEAESSYQQTIRFATSQGQTMPLGTADLYRGLAELYLEWGDLEAAAHYVLTSQRLGEQTATTDWPHRLCLSQARLKEAQGDLDGTLALLDEAQRVYVRVPLPDVRPVAALKARVWLKQGRLSQAMDWARERGLSVDHNLSYLSEFEYITLARICITQYKSEHVATSLDEAIRLLGRLLQAAEAGRRISSVIEILLLHALAFQARGSFTDAFAALERALALAEPRGYVRMFVNEGTPMVQLLERMKTTSERMKAYLHRLLAAFGEQDAVHASSAMPHTLLEPLSQRELEVLKLLRSELSGPEIAQQLIVSLHTLRTHTNNIFNKLGVNNRRAAVRRAEELALF